jgi:hypothetical protein
MIDASSADKLSEIELAVLDPMPEVIVPVENAVVLAKTGELTLVEKIQAKFADQDFNQRLGVSTSVVIELYKILSSSLLILFVPQDCNGEACTLSDNMVATNGFYHFALAFNFFTLAAFLLLYRVEVIRENRLIKYLDVNSELPNDNEQVEQRLQILPIDKRDKIISIDKYYQTLGYASIVIFIMNLVFSSVVVNEYYLGNQTTTTMITYALVMVSKLSSVYAVANTDKNVFYSAYLKANVQYNDVDKDIVKTIEG